MTTSPKTFQLRIRLIDVDPEVWRRVVIEGNFTLHELHRVIQLIFSWSDYHLYEFEIAGRRFQAPDAEADAEDAAGVALEALGLQRGAVFIYTYDFGDSWQHEVRVEEVRRSHQDNILPRVIDGARRGPPEDCGGPERYKELLRVIELPPDELDLDETELVEWAGPDFDPDDFSVAQADHALMLCAAWESLSNSR